MTSPVTSGVASFALLVRNLFALGANLLPAYGVLYLGVDPFQVLMLYWMETAIIGFWMVLTLGRLPAHLLGEVTINGRVQHATNAILVKLFGGMTLCFMARALLPALGGILQRLAASRQRTDQLRARICHRLGRVGAADADLSRRASPAFATRQRARTSLA